MGSLARGARADRVAIVTIDRAVALTDGKARAYTDRIRGGTKVILRSLARLLAGRACRWWYNMSNRELSTAKCRLFAIPHDWERAGSREPNLTCWRLRTPAVCAIPSA
jgi:hypothetical protein